MKISLICGVLAPVINKGGEYYGLIPEGYVPDWVRALVAFFALIGYVGGRLTTHEKDTKKNPANS